MDLNDMKDWLILLVLVALIGAAASIVLTDFRKEIDSDAGVTQFNNESVTFASRKGSVSQSYLFNSLVGIYNGTTAGSAAGSLSNTCNVSSVGGIECNSTDAVVNVTYTFTTPTHQRNMTTNGLLGAGNATNYLGTIGTIMGVAILIGMVIGAFYIIKR